MAVPEAVVVALDNIPPWKEGGATKLAFKLTFSSNPSGGYSTGGIDLDKAFEPFGILSVHGIQQLRIFNASNLQVPIQGRWNEFNQTLFLSRQGAAADFLTAQVPGSTDISGWEIHGIVVSNRLGADFAAS